MPGLVGLEVIRQVSRRFPGIHVIVLSMHATEDYVLEALRNGAFGYIPKESSVTEVVKGVRAVAAGQRFLSTSLPRLSIEVSLERGKTGPQDVYNSLTSREREVLQLAAEGHSSIEIGRRLFISPRTVEIHRQNAMRKLSLRNQGDLVRYALKKGILPETEVSSRSIREKPKSEYCRGSFPLLPAHANTRPGRGSQIT